MSFEHELMLAMSEWDLHVNTIQPEIGIYHRFRSIGTCKTKCCEYRIYERYLGAHFRCWRRGISRFWNVGRDSPFDLEERRIMQMERDRINADRQLMYAKTASRCEQFYIRRNSEPPQTHPYVRRKMIFPYAARGCRTFLVIPVCDIYRKIQTLQFIQPNGFKKLKTGGKSGEGMVWLCDPLPRDYDGVLRICEGWSTGCSIRYATGSPVVCALNAYNLPKVCVLLAKNYPHMKGIICADNDAWKEKNVGMDCAADASKKTGYPVYCPDFTGFETGHKPTDYNDLFLLGGKEELRRQLTIR